MKKTVNVAGQAGTRLARRSRNAERYCPNRQVPLNAPLSTRLSAEQRLAFAPAGDGATAQEALPIFAGVATEVLPKSASNAVVRYALNHWEALTRFLDDDDLEIDKGATDGLPLYRLRPGRLDVLQPATAVAGRRRLLRSFIACAKGCGFEPL